MNNIGLTALGFFLFAGITAAGWFASQTIVNGRTAANTATVKGLAERIVPADLANWEIEYSASARTTGEPDFDDLYRRASEKRDAITAVIAGQGFSDTEMSMTPLAYSSHNNRDHQGRFLNTDHFVSGSVSVSTSDLKKIEAAYFALSELPRQGITLSLLPPSYLFNDLNAIKPEMLREATENARIAADEFARNAGVEVGGIQSARQGGFSIRDVRSEHSETRSLEKVVRVVTTITFYLEN